MKGLLFLFSLTILLFQLNPASTTFVVFTFDTEEDYNHRTYCWDDSYKYITSGAFYQLVDGLNERNVSATFYVTPNLASLRLEGCQKDSKQSRVVSNLCSTKENQ